MSRVKRPPKIHGNFAYIELTKGYTAKVDLRDVDVVKHHNWFAHTTPRNVYAARNAKKEDGRTGMVFMHREILQPSLDQQVDHKDGHGLNNTRSNLRLCSRIENSRNRRKPSNNTSGYKGVSWKAQSQRWIAQISNGKYSECIGLFKTKEEAYQAYLTESNRRFADFSNPG